MYVIVDHGVELLKVVEVVTARHQPPYPTPAAFRRALTDRLRAIAVPHGPWPPADLQRQFAYDRLLTRLYLLDDAWILRGATAIRSFNELPSGLLIRLGEDHLEQ